MASHSKGPLICQRLSNKTTILSMAAAVFFRKIGLMTRLFSFFCAIICPEFQNNAECSVWEHQLCTRHRTPQNTGR